jgi:hypothetical protein
MPRVIASAMPVTIPEPARIMPPITPPKMPATAWALTSPMPGPTAMVEPGAPAAAIRNVPGWSARKV